ncbi:MAG: hypothetical protein N3A66_12450, partial [Planctomycetota bacterium]|nr:hypothetical protein [Planctomycetota bacterium]
MDIAGSHQSIATHEQLDADLTAKVVDGVLLFAPDYRYDHAGALRSYGVPLVVLGGKGDHWRCDFDYQTFIRLAAEEMARAAICHASLIAPPARIPLLAEAMQQHGQPCRIDDWSYETWVAFIPDVGTRENCAYRVAKRMLAQRNQQPLPQAVVSCDDTATRGLINALLQDGLQPGRDLKVITSANIGSNVLTPYADSIVQIAFEPAEITAAMFKTLEALMAGQQPASNPVYIC